MSFLPVHIAASEIAAGRHADGGAGRPLPVAMQTGGWTPREWRRQRTPKRASTSSSTKSRTCLSEVLQPQPLDVLDGPDDVKIGARCGRHGRELGLVRRQPSTLSVSTTNAAAIAA